MSASLFNLTRQWSLNAIIADFPSPSSYRKNFDSFSKLFILRRRGFSHIGALDGTVPVRGRDRESTVDVPLPKERQRSRIGAEETSFPTSNLRDADHRNPISTSQQNQPIQTFTSVYDLAKKQRPENEPSTEQAPIRTFKSIYEVARKDPDSASWGDKMKSIQDDFFEWHPEEKINHLKHVKRCQLQAENRVIMNVSPRDAILLLQPTRLIVCVIATFPVYYLAKWAVLGCGVPALPMQLLTVSAPALLLYRYYFSSICTQIDMDPRTSTYLAWFPFRLFEKQVIFRKSQVKHTSTKRNRHRTCHLDIKGIRAFCPRRCFVSHTHYDELICSTSKIRNRKYSR